MDRREFFTRSAGKAAQTLTKHAVKKAREKASHWIRPPFAIEEFDFLIACNRCGDCIDACPQHIIFPLSSKLGASVFNTPALNLINQACHLCEDWPCVNACEKSALVRPVPDENSTPKKSLPKLSIISINKEQCLPYSGPECGACNFCPVPGAMIWDMEKPEINPELCTGCALCREYCIATPKAITIQSIYK